MIERNGVLGGTPRHFHGLDGLFIGAVHGLRGGVFRA